ncbi:hypothetical protein GCK72_012211 [Caenorhabditis remanei]|uniref:SCP domain-containing protein n=1 Tax=Caenorhabditis remanei TaxID=31234 RepID=A0A6A5GM84_CAERE|nr:hypothetical protein GCK72_012211 [Caenorhabditis remanei]KAF1755761.1 hypothetical protein GCK72_012211 [Caenorhabditis remanei]
MLNFFLPIILLFTASTVSASPAALHTGFQQKSLEYINSFRSRFAHAAQIANMQKMRYNRTLEATIQNFTSSCDLLDNMEDMPTPKHIKIILRHTKIILYKNVLGTGSYCDSYSASIGYPSRLCIDGYSM